MSFSPTTLVSRFTPRPSSEHTYCSAYNYSSLFTFAVVWVISLVAPCGRIVVQRGLHHRHVVLPPHGPQRDRPTPLHAAGAVQADRRTPRHSCHLREASGKAAAVSIRHSGARFSEFDVARYSILFGIRFLEFWTRFLKPGLLSLESSFIFRNLKVGVGI